MSLVSDDQSSKVGFCLRMRLELLGRKAGYPESDRPSLSSEILGRPSVRDGDYSSY